ncbi:carbohydrate kinase family protein [Treponema zioleckii]|uniref:carbohydrate kinase family protein n=1 Tax=Treponema zioleckii TaxID=331680 RepID=UPI00168A5C97|nr:carbohydrate kinase [Treponema zioleckii]
MEKKFDVAALGEILIDFTFAGKSADGKNLFEENPGGAPANCVAALTKLGGKGAFLGMTGTDSFGADLRAVLENLKINTDGLCTTKAQHTTLAFVSLDENGERHFSFCRNPGADTQLSAEDLNKNVLENAKILHIGSLSLTDEPAKSATEEAVKIVKNAGGLVSYDPNYRENLWGNRKDAISIIKGMIPKADILKISEEEFFLLYGTNCSHEAAANEILSEGTSLVLITLGAEGVFYAFKNGSCKIETGTVKAKKTTAVDTTGAGDSFNGGLLYKLTRRAEPLKFNKSNLEDDLSFANTVAAICVSRRGAIPALPTLSEVENFKSV